MPENFTSISIFPVHRRMRGYVHESADVRGFSRQVNMLKKHALIENIRETLRTLDSGTMIYGYGRSRASRYGDDKSPEENKRAIPLADNSRFI